MSPMTTNWVPGIVSMESVLLNPVSHWAEVADALAYLLGEAGAGDDDHRRMCFTDRRDRVGPKACCTRCWERSTGPRRT